MNTLNDLKPNIAFFDSGQGGLTIWERVIKRFPKLNTQYLGDNARYPYGNKSESTITRYASEAVLFLANRKALMLIVACGTASSVAVPKLKTIFKFPVIGIVESFCQYVGFFLKGKKGSVAVIATRFTIKSNRFEIELAKHGIYNVWSQACPLFVPLIEEGISAGPMVDAACQMYFYDMPKDVKVILLACTHYSRIVEAVAENLKIKFNRDVIYKTDDGEKILQKGSEENNPIYLLDPFIAMADEIQNFLNLSPISVEGKIAGEHIMMCTDTPTQFEATARIFVQEPFPKVEQVDLLC